MAAVLVHRGPLISPCPPFCLHASFSVPFILRRAAGRGPLNSNNPARRPSIFHFIKGAAALLLHRNDSTDLPPSLPIGSAPQPFWPTIKQNIR